MIPSTITPEEFVSTLIGKPSLETLDKIQAAVGTPEYQEFLQAIEDYFQTHRRSGFNQLGRLYLSSAPLSGRIRLLTNKRTSYSLRCAARSLLEFGKRYRRSKPLMSGPISAPSGTPSSFASANCWIAENARRGTPLASLAGEGSPRHSTRDNAATVTRNEAETETAETIGGKNHRTVGCTRQDAGRP